MSEYSLPKSLHAVECWIAVKFE